MSTLITVPPRYPVTLNSNIKKSNPHVSWKRTVFTFLSEIKYEHSKTITTTYIYHYVLCIHKWTHLKMIKNLKKILIFHWRNNVSTNKMCLSSSKLHFPIFKTKQNKIYLLNSKSKCRSGRRFITLIRHIFWYKCELILFRIVIP